MSSNDIQELLDGGLPDEASAELLHKLSISPEHRVAFQQHLALRGAFERDRAESVMQQDEDAMVWAGIVGGVPPAAAPVAGGLGLWRMAAAFSAIAALLVGSYVIGRNSTDTARVVLDNRPLTLPAVTALFGAVQGERNSVVKVSTESAAGLENAGAVAPRTIWRDRIVYRDRFIERNRGANLAGRDGGTAEGINAANPLAASRSSSAAPSLAMLSGFQPIDVAALSPTTPAASVPVGRSSAVALAVQRTGLDPLALASTSSMAESNPPLLRDGFEASYTERVGRLGALPQANVSDPTYTTRSLGLGYRFADGALGLGARIGNGTFPTVALEPTQRVRREGAQSRIDTLYVPTLEARHENTVELFVNYRLALLDRLALGVEGAFNKSTRHSRVGADLTAFWFLTDRIGLQGGIGVGRYSYDLSGSRESLLEQGENVGVSDAALDKYEGTVIEGRYGVLVQF